MVLATLGLPERDFLVLGPLDPLLLVEVPMVNLSLSRNSSSAYSGTLFLFVSGLLPSGAPPAISLSLRILLLVTMAEELS